MKSRFQNIFIISILLLSQIQISEQKHWWLQGSSPILNDNQFREKVGKEEYYAVNFFTPWCMYCQQMVQEWSKLSDHFIKQNEDPQTETKVQVVKVNCDDNRPLCQSMGIYSFPDIRMFGPQNQGTIANFQGRRSAENLQEWIDNSVVNHKQRMELIKQQQQQQEELKKQQTDQQQENQEQQKKEEEKQGEQNDVVTDDQIVVDNQQIKVDQEEQPQQQNQNQEDNKEEQEKQQQPETKTETKTNNNEENQQQKNNQNDQKLKEQEKIIQDLQSQIEQVKQKEQQTLQEKRSLENKLIQLYSEVKQIKDQLHDFRKQEVSQSKETLTTLNDYLYQETEQQQNLYNSHQKMIELEEQLIGKKPQKNTEDIKQDQQQQQNINEDKGQQNKQIDNKSQRDMQKITEHNQLFVFGMTGIFIGFVIAFVSIKKPKQQYNPQLPMANSE